MDGVLCIVLPIIEKSICNKVYSHTSKSISEIQASILLLAEHQKELEDKMNIILEENAELKSQNRELKKVITKIEE